MSRFIERSWHTQVVNRLENDLKASRAEVERLRGALADARPTDEMARRAKRTLEINHANTHRTVYHYALALVTAYDAARAALGEELKRPCPMCEGKGVLLGCAGDRSNPPCDTCKGTGSIGGRA